MQSTIGRGLTDRVRGLRVHHVAAIGGLALAVAAAVGFGRLEDETQPAARTPAPAAPPSAVSAAVPDQFLVYMVATQAQKRALEQDVATAPEWFVESYAGMNTEVRILVLHQEQEESLDTLARLLPEASIATGQGPAVKLIDMR